MQIAPSLLFHLSRFYGTAHSNWHFLVGKFRLLLLLLLFLCAEAILSFAIARPYKPNKRTAGCRRVYVP